MQNKADKVSKTDTPLTHHRSPGVHYKKGPGWIYFIRCGNAVKIGYALNVSSRLRQIQTCNPVTLELIGSFRGSQEDEQQLHLMFIYLHIRGEWFREHPAILEYVNATDHKRHQIRTYGSAKLNQLTPLPPELVKLLESVKDRSAPTAR